jgi:hypothetical protein
MANGQSPIAGWYPDPLGDPARLRYWDGEGWTDHYHPVAGYDPGARTETFAEDGTGAAPSPAANAAPDPPLPPPPAEPTTPTAPSGRPSGLGLLAGIAAAGLALVSLAEVNSLFADLNFRSAEEEVLNGLEVNRIAGATLRSEDAGDWLIAGYVAAGLAFLPWFYRAYANLPKLMPHRLDYGTEWAVAAWLVPFLNLVRPKHIADEIYRVSAAATRTSGKPVTRRSLALLNFWWATFLLSGAGALVGTQMIESADNDPIASQQALIAAIEQEQNGFLVTACASGLAIVSALLAIIFVLRVTGMQRDASERGSAPAMSPTLAPAATAVGTGTAGGSPGAGPLASSQGPPGWQGP